jgi:hypothetical protein
MRPDVSSLPLVSAGALIVRFINPLHYVHTAPPGQRILQAAFPSKDFAPASDSYGASAYEPGKLPGGLSDLEAAFPRWSTFGVAQVRAEELADLGIEVRRSPGDCPFPSVQEAHVSLIGITRDVRDRLVVFLEGRLLRLPTPR